MLFYAADAPTDAAWLEAWATLAGAVLSAAAVLVAVFLVRQEQKHRREDRQDAESAQARLVQAKCLGIAGDPESGWTGVHYRVVNHSSSEVSDVEIQVYQTFTLDSAMERIEDLADRHAGLVRFERAAAWPFQSAEPTIAELGSRLLIRVVFTDSEGRRWRRIEGSEPQRHRKVERPHDLRFALAVYLNVYTNKGRLKRLYDSSKRRVVLALLGRIEKRRQREWARRHPNHGPLEPFMPPPSDESGN